MFHPAWPGENDSRQTDEHDAARAFPVMVYFQYKTFRASSTAVGLALKQEGVRVHAEATHLPVYRLTLTWIEGSLWIRCLRNRSIHMLRGRCDVIYTFLPNRAVEVDRLMVAVVPQQHLASVRRHKRKLDVSYNRHAAGVKLKLTHMCWRCWRSAFLSVPHGR